MASSECQPTRVLQVFACGLLFITLSVIPTFTSFGTRPVIHASLSRESLHSLAVSNARRKLAERRAWLASNHSEHAEFAALSLTTSPAWYLFTPVLPCAGTFDKTPRSDVRHDGGKWLCGLEEEARASSLAVHLGLTQRVCVVYSFGSNNEFSFEERVHFVAPHCIIHTFDPTSSPPSSNLNAAKFITFHDDYGLGGSNGPATTTRNFPIKSLETIIGELGHNALTVLKIDTEGSEWDVIMETNWEKINTMQILLELHPKLGGVRTVSDVLPYFERLEAAGYFLASIEPVTCSDFSQVEVVFLNELFIPGA